MRNGFAKRLAAVLLALCVAAALPMMSAFAAPAPAEYVITFSGGEYGKYTDAFLERLSDDGYVATASEDMTTITVKVKGNQTLPDQPNSSELISTNEDVYRVWFLGNDHMQATGCSAEYVSGSLCKSNYTLTPTFYLASENDKQYVMRYLVNGTEAEAAPAEYGFVPESTFQGEGYSMALSSVPTPAEYTLNVAVTVANSNGAITQDGQNLVLKAVGEGIPEFIFYYDQITHVNTVTEYVAGDTIVNYNDVTLVGGAGVAGGGAGGAGAGAGAGGEEIPDEETPQAGGETIPDDSTPQAGGEEIPDESTPQAGGDAAAAGVSMPMVVGGVVVVLAILLIVLLALRKRKGGADGE